MRPAPKGLELRHFYATRLCPAVATMRYPAVPVPAISAGVVLQASSNAAPFCLVRLTSKKVLRLTDG